MWSPIITCPILKDRIESKLVELNDISITLESDDLSLIEGISGRVLFKVYYSHLCQKPELLQEVLSDLNIIFSKCHNIPTINLSFGYAGINFLLNHLQKEGKFEFERDSLIMNKEHIKEYMNNTRNLDFLHGASGIMVSLFESDNHEYNEEIYSLWLKILKETNENDPLEFKYKILVEQTFGVWEKVYSFGLAHGLPSILVILTKYALIHKNSNTLDIADKIMKFILKSRYPDDHEFFFPHQVLNGTKMGGRIAWCYGDLGCALSIYLYAKYTNNKDLIDLSNNIFIKHCSKRDLNKYQIWNAHFCHGSIGVAQIYARMYNYTGIEIYRETAEFWYKTTLDLATYSDGIAGYKNRTTTGYVNSKGILEGVYGIGLGLISSISNVEPKWDSCFLLSI